jgi:hypothetical protein
MEILYVIGMIAVFVLCLVLFSTARRILGTSSLSIAQVVGSRTYGGMRLESDMLEDVSSARVIPTDEAVRFESSLAIDEPLLFETTARTAFIAPAPPASSIDSATPGWIEEDELPEIAEPPQKSKWSWLPKPTRQTYNYALECALLGVSAWLLIRTQQDAMRNRSTQSSRNRVA